MAATKCRFRLCVVYHYRDGCAETADARQKKKGTPMYINGNWLSAKNECTFDVFNPANGEIIDQVPDGGREDAVLAIQSADEAFKNLVRYHGL
jgi:hypothetical protein